MKSGVKIMVIGPRGFPGVQGGIERFSEELYPLLVQAGCLVTSFSISRFSDLSEWRGVKFIRLPVPGFKFAERPLYNFFAALHCIVRRPDIVHVHSIASGLFIFLMKLFGLKIICRYNSMDHLHSKWNFIGRFILRLSERQFFLADHIVANNPFFLSYLMKKGRTARISLLPNGVEEVDQKLYESDSVTVGAATLSKRKYALYVGRLTSEKNVHTLVDSFLKLGDPTLHLVIAGEAAHREEYSVRLREYAKAETIHFFGKANREQLNRLYANCALFVNPSISEGMPNTLLEAMSFNCPVLVSRIPAHQQFNLDEGSYFDSRNTEELTRKIKEQIAERPKPDYVELLKPYRWSSVLEKIMHVHKEVLHS